MRVARYCNWRINRQVNEEDRVLTSSVQNGMASGSYRRPGRGKAAQRQPAMRALIPGAPARTPRGRLVEPARRG
jgi:hypothetical protein